MGRLRIVLLLLSFWTVEDYDWYKCHESSVYDVYVIDQSLCVNDAVLVIDGLIVKVLPRYGFKDCLEGPGTSVCDECIELYDHDNDGDVDLRDYSWTL